MHTVLLKTNSHPFIMHTSTCTFIFNNQNVDIYIYAYQISYIIKIIKKNLTLNIDKKN